MDKIGNPPGHIWEQGGQNWEHISLAGKTALNAPQARYHKNRGGQNWEQGGQNWEQALLSGCSVGDSLLLSKKKST